METIRGKASREIGLNELRDRLAGYSSVLLDLGTGDGRYAATLARQQPACFVIGVDACRENLRQQSRMEQRNMLFVIAEAGRLPCELNGLASRIAINFPWGSLLEGLLNPDSDLMRAMALASHAAASLEVRLNAGALAEAGTALEAGAEQVCRSLSRSGWVMHTPTSISAVGLRGLPTTWARRLAFGRDPRAIQINGWLRR